MAAKLSAPVDVQIELTQACNQRCRHCYNYWRPNSITVKSEQHFPREKFSRLVGELRANQVPSITITGGEPFLRRNDVFVLLKMIQEVDIHASINTNLSLIKEDDIDRLADKYKDVSLLFSLLSGDAIEHERLAGVSAGTYAQVVKNAALAIQKGIPVSLNMVLMRENLHSMESVARLAKSLGVRTFCATKALPNTHAPEEAFLLSAEEVRWSLVELIKLERLLDISVDVLGCYPRCLFTDTDSYRRFSRRTCVAGYTTVTIGVDGNVRPCSHMEISYGNIFYELLADIWQKMSGWRENEFIPEECHGCLLVAACRGGCRVDTFTPGLKNIDIYADPQRPKDALQRYLVSRSSEKKTEIPPKAVVCTQVRFRNETFGALVYRTNPLAIVLVNYSAAKFLKTMAERNESFDFTTFLQQSNAKSESECLRVEQLYRKLIEKKLLVVSNQ